MTVSRNIHLLGGKYRVLITRRPKNVYGGRFSTLSEAIAARDRIERNLPARKPWACTEIKTARRTVQQLRAERKAAGLCISCGDEPPKSGCVSCQSCLDVLNFKRRERRRVA